MSSCPACGKDTKAAGHILAECLANKGNQIVRQATDRGQIVRQVKMRDFLRQSRKELGDLPFELVSDGRVVALVRQAEVRKWA